MIHPFVKEFKERGFFFQCTDEEALSKALIANKKPTAYIGFDCTATSLHVGSLIQIMILKLLQKHGIKPIVLLGGATTKIGDPTWKDKTRPLLTDEDITANTYGIKYCIEKFVKFGNNSTDAILLNNNDWLGELNYLDLLRQVGVHFSINRMLTFDSVKLRLEREQNLTFLEFNYMILQGYDFMHLNKAHDCILQCGGSDQWGNIVSGIELTRKMLSKEVFGITTPLLTTSSGTKMGKTEKGAVWLNEDLLSPYDYYQFWRNSEDNDVFKFMRLFTDLSLNEIHAFEEDRTTNINEYKKILAFEATKLCHGSRQAEESQKTAISVFEQGNMERVAEFILDRSLLEKDGIFIYEVFKLSGLCDSNGSAKRLIRGSGASLNQEKITDELLKIHENIFLEKGYITISAGKKNHIKVTIR
jgi:tyrosyl-tRNA synthetase